MTKNGKELNWARRTQRDLLKATSSVVEVVSKGAEVGKEGLQKLDKTAQITEKTRSLGKAVLVNALALDEKYGIIDKTNIAKTQIKKINDRLVDEGVQYADKSGVTDALISVRNKANDKVFDPALKIVKSTGIEEKVTKSLAGLGEIYGDTREIIKPYFVANDPRELLEQTRAELAQVSACIMQINSSESEKLANQFGKAVVSKISGVAASGALITLVATFGTSGTGTAIAALSGAASTSATLAWVGGLLGGGMAAGAVLTGGITIIVGLTTYKLLGTERRPFESLSEVEQRVVQSSWLVMAIIDDYLKSPPDLFTKKEAELLLVNFFHPLLNELATNSDAICGKLDGRHALIFRQHVLTDFKRVVIDGFEHFVQDYPMKGFYNAEYVIGGVFYALLTQTAVSSDVESQLVLEALRRSSCALTHASESELGDYLRELSPEGMKGVGSNVKGIYHELIYTQNYNDSHSDTYAELFQATNHPGADIQIKDIKSHDILEEYQLKAVTSTEPINFHLHRYPDIHVLATNEVAEKFTDPRVESSGHENEVLKARVNDDLHSVAENTLSDRTWDSFLLAAGVASTRELFEMVNGQRAFPDAIANACKAASASGAATLMAAYLFS